MSACFIFPPLIVFEIPFFAILLGELGYHVIASAQKKLQGKVEGSQFQECDLVFATKGGVEVGILKAEDGSISLVCDEQELELVEGITKEELQKNLVQKYTHKKVAEELAQHGFTIVEEEQLADETIKIKVRRWN